MKILAGYYTNNQVRQKVLKHSLAHFITASKNGPVIPIVSSWDSIPDLPCRNILSHFRIEGHGHLNILLQLLQIVQAADEQWDYFAFCEHDCLYPPNYFADIERRLSDCQASGLASENHIGLFPNGFADCWYTTMQPLFAMVVRKDCLLESIYIKLKECAAKGWCCLEPDDRTSWFIIKPNRETPPIIHINMNTTSDNHHLTNLYDFYSIETAQERHSFWGDYRQFEIFTDTDVEVATKPILPRGTYRIVAAMYGSFDSDRTVSYLTALERKDFRGLFRVSNAEAGLDPAPGVIKSLRLNIVTVGNSNSLNYEFKEGSIFRL
jgi:hypothetical protein